MDKKILIQRVQKKLAVIKDYRYPETKYAPEHAIWFQRQENLRAFVSLVNNKYRYEIYNHNTGKRLVDEYEKNLPLAKKEVFNYFNKHKN